MDQSLIDFSKKQLDKSTGASKDYPVDKSLVDFSAKDPKAQEALSNPNLNAPQYTPPQDTPSPLDQAAPMPYLATAVDKYGRPFYGDGFQGLARKIFANLFAPSNFDYNDPRINLESSRAQTQANMENALHWQSWGEKIFGISSQEASQGITAMNAETGKAQLTGKSLVGQGLSQATSLLTKMPGVMWDVATSVIGTTDWASRKAVAFSAGVQAASNVVDVTQPPQTQIEKDLAAAKNVGDAWLGVINPIVPLVQASVALVAGKTTIGKITESVSQDMAGSGMIYSSLIDPATKATFVSRMNTGENPTFLSEELQNPLVETIGGVVGDPLTWSGAPVLGDFGKAAPLMKIPFTEKYLSIGGKVIMVPWKVVGHLPEFGDALALVGIKVGKARLADEVAKMTESVVKVDPALGDLAKMADNPTSMQTVIEASKRAVSDIEASVKDYSPISLQANGKAAGAGRDASNVLRNLLNYSHDNEEVFQVVHDYKMLNTGTQAEKELAATSLMTHVMGPVLTSEKGLKVGQFLTRLEGDGALQKILDAAGGDKAKLAESLFSHYDKVLHEVYASVDDMKRAADLVKAGDKTAEVVRMADRYDKLPEYVKAVRNVTAKLDKAYAPVIGTMGDVYIRWNPAFFAKNIEGQTPRIMMDMGLGAGAEIGARATLAAKKGWAEIFNAQHIEDSKNMLGYTHEAIARGFEGTGVKGIMGKTTEVAQMSKVAANRAEQVTSGEIVVRTMREVIQKALKIQPPELDALEKALPGSRDIMYKLLQKYDGNGSRALSEFRQIFSSGNIAAEKYVQMPEKLQKFLGDTRMLDAVRTIQKNEAGLTQEEVVQKITDLLASAKTKTVDALSAVPATLGQNVANEMPVMAETAVEAQALHADNVVTTPVADGFTRVTQAYQNAREAMHTLINTLLPQIGTEVGRRGLPTSINDELVAGVNSAKATSASFGDIGAVRDTVRQVYRAALKHEAPLADLWKQVVVGQLFDLSKTHPNLDASVMSTQQFNRVLWESFYDWSGKYFHSANVTDYNTQMQAISNAADAIGVPVQNLLKDNGLFLNADNAMHLAEQHYQNFSLASSRIPEGTTLAQMFQGALKEYGWTRGKDAILSAVNADRRANNLAEAATAADVPFQEALRAMANRGANIPGMEAATRVTAAAPVSGQAATATEAIAGQAKTAAAPVVAATEAPNKAQDFQAFSDWATTKGGASVSDALKAFEDPNSPLAKKFAQETGKVVSGLKIPPPFDGERPSFARAVYENMKDGSYEKDVNGYLQSIRDAWGKKIPVSNMTPEAQKALESFMGAHEKRMSVVRTVAAASATARRDFLLHSYDKTYLDHAFSYISPFHYWTDRTYVRTAEQLVENPGFVAGFAKYMKFNEQQFAGLPDWWKQNTQIPDLLGVDQGHPLFINLLAAINPINGLIGIDFNDPYKRTDWLSTTVDNLNKFGPTLTPLISWAVGLHLYNQGQVDAGQRWFGRLFPQSAYLKAGVTLGQNAVAGVTGTEPKMWNMGPFVQNNEFDPFVNFIEGGLDPYERGRVGRAITSIEQTKTDQINSDPNLSPEQKQQAIGDLTAKLDEAAYSHAGPIWDQAVHLATSIRAPGQLSAAILGIGAKPRTSSDMQIDQFYGDMNKLYAMAGSLSSDQYKAGWDGLRKKYPFMDTLLLARKSDNTRDSAYAYSVLGRIPPGMSDNFLKQVGVMREDINKFYDSKGFSDPNVQYTQTERQRFNTAIVDLGTMLTMPSDATKAEWQAAKNGYAAMDSKIAAQLKDPTIWDKVTAYYNAPNPDAKSKILAANPGISQAFELQNRMMLENPTVYKYYGSLNNIQKYYDAQVRTQLEATYGSDIYDKYYQYLDTLDAKAKSAYYKAHPEIAKFVTDKNAISMQVNAAVVRTAKNLPTSAPTTLRQDFTALSGAQGRLAQVAAQPQNAPPVSSQELADQMSPSLKNLVAEYMGGKDLPYAARQQLDYIGNPYGLSADEVLQILGLGR